jgi:hypothetical protein
MGMHGTTSWDYNNASMPHLIKPSYTAALVLNRDVAALPCRGRTPASANPYYGGQWKEDPQVFVVGFGDGGSNAVDLAATRPAMYAVWVTDVMPDYSLQCADIQGSERREYGARFFYKDLYSKAVSDDRPTDINGIPSTPHRTE